MIGKKASDLFDLGELTNHVGPDLGHTHSHQVLDQHIRENPQHQVRCRIELGEIFKKDLTPLT